MSDEDTVCWLARANDNLKTKLKGIGVGILQAKAPYHYMTDQVCRTFKTILETSSLDKLRRLQVKLLFMIH